MNRFLPTGTAWYCSHISTYALRTGVESPVTKGVSGAGKTGTASTASAPSATSIDMWG